MSSEHERIARLEKWLGRDNPEVEIGIGDDCAVLSPAASSEVWTIDAAVEGIHFLREGMALDAIGYRAFMAAASDIAAMGARARAALSALILPQSFSDDALEQLMSGMARAADVCECSIAGGNLARGSELSITTTVLGIPYGPALLRSGARVGDRVYVTGPLGGAALGLSALCAEETAADAAPFVSAYLRPRARLDLARHLSEVATSAIDISDGLVQDAGHVATASNVALHLERERIPTLPGFERLCQRLGQDVLEKLLTGGDDYEVLFTAPQGLELGWATPIGEVHDGPAAVCVRDAQGKRLDVAATGFDHFR